jgi:hypothetical protein
MTSKVAHSPAMLANAALVITFDQTEASHVQGLVLVAAGQLRRLPRLPGTTSFFSRVPVATEW